MPARRNIAYATRVWGPNLRLRCSKGFLAPLFLYAVFGSHARASKLLKAVERAGITLFAIVNSAWFNK
jgi:hypothetical protein